MMDDIVMDDIVVEIDKSMEKIESYLYKAGLKWCHMPEFHEVEKDNSCVETDIQQFGGVVAVVFKAHFGVCCYEINCNNYKEIIDPKALLCLTRLKDYVDRAISELKVQDKNGKED